MDWLKALASPITELVKSVGGVIDNLHTSDTEKLDAQRKLLELERAFQAKVLDIEVQRAQTQAEVIKAEIGGSWMAANWRPLLMIVFTFIIFNNYVLVPLFKLPAAEIPVQMWDLLQIGMGGYIFGRTAEKVAPSIAAAFKK